MECSSGWFDMRDLALDTVAQHAYRAEIDLDFIVGLHPQRRRPGEAHALRRAGHDHVARFQRRDTGQIRDEEGYVEDELAYRGVLHDRAVETRGQFERTRIGDLVGGREPRAERA